jgi:copper chaperone
VIAFQVNDMTCGHCVSTIAKALKWTDKDAKVQFDLATHRIEVEPSVASFEELSDAIKDAGYTPLAVAGSSASSPNATKTKRGGCCCG